MEFSESGKDWRSLPGWADFLLQFGYRWARRSGERRRIALISMPSESPAAGMVSLGAMRRYLELADANDVKSHFRRLNALASRGDVIVRHPARPGRWLLDVDSAGTVWARQLPRKKHGRSVSIPWQTASEWQFDGEAPISVSSGKAIPNLDLYENLVSEGESVRPANLSSTDSEVCLAGSVAGGANTRARMEDVWLRSNGCSASLGQLLTVQEWMPGTVSRVMFFNSRTEQFDRDARIPQLVVADGDNCFLRIIDLEKFQDSDVVGVLHRTLDRDRLEAVGNRLAALRQWYEPDTEILGNLPTVPAAISVSVLRRI